MSSELQPRGGRGTRRASGGVRLPELEDALLWVDKHGSSDAGDVDPEDVVNARADDARSQWLQAQRPPHWG